MLTGVWIHPNDSAADLLGCIENLDRSGVDQVWLGDEGVSRDPFAILASAAVRTQRIELGVGVTNPVLRHPAIVASAASTIAELSSDRFILGWGSGGSESLEPFGLRAIDPVGAVARAVELSRSVLEGDTTPDYSPPPHASPRRHVRQYIGARGPRLISLASSIADGVLLSGIHEESLHDIVARARSVRPIEIALYQTVRSSGSEQPGVLVGTAELIAARLHTMCSRYDPTSIGVACIDETPLQRRIDFSVDILGTLKG